jgi:hypothetical protein
MLAICLNRGVGLAIADERRGGGWQSLMREGSGVGEKLISNGSTSDEGGAATLPKKSLAFGFFFFCSKQFHDCR